MNAVNSDVRLALSPGCSGQRDIEPGRDEKKNNTHNNVSKLEDKSAQRDSERGPIEIALRQIITKQSNEDPECEIPNGASVVHCGSLTALMEAPGRAACDHRGKRGC